jgi:hypothetical protein
MTSRINYGNYRIYKNFFSDHDFFSKFIQVWDKQKGAGAAIRNFGSSAPTPKH